MLFAYGWFDHVWGSWLAIQPAPNPLAGTALDGTVTIVLTGVAAGLGLDL